MAKQAQRMATWAWQRRRLSGTAAFVLGLLTCQALTAHPATAGPLLDAAIEAEKFAASGDSRAAFAAIHAGLSRFSESLPLTVPHAVFITQQPTAYGSYTAKPDAVFRPGEPVMTYLEVVGLHWNTVAEGQLEAHFTVDLQLRSASGRLVALKKQFGNIRYASRTAAQEVFTHLTLDLAGAEPGAYRLGYTVNDIIAERSVSFELPFSIAEAG